MLLSDGGKDGTDPNGVCTVPDLCTTFPPAANNLIFSLLSHHTKPDQPCSRGRVMVSGQWEWASTMCSMGVFASVVWPVHREIGRIPIVL